MSTSCNPQAIQRCVDRAVESVPRPAIVDMVRYLPLCEPCFRQQPSGDDEVVELFDWTGTSRSSQAIQRCVDRAVGLVPRPAVIDSVRYLPPI